MDDAVLGIQHAIDRLVHRLLHSGTSVPVRRRLLIVQIDGLSRAVLQQGLSSGYTPALKRLLQRHGYRLEPMTVGLPTSTPAFQMAAMYGVRPDIPGFHFYDRERRADTHFLRPGHAALVEAKQAAGRHGILQGGSAYGCCFTGGAENDLFSFTRLSRPTGRGLFRALSPVVVLGWVCAKNLLRTVVELAKSVSRLAAHPVAARQGWRWLTIKLGFSVWVRGFFTLAAARDLYAGVGAVYVNYVDYDVAAHAFGPRSRPALLTLRRVDRSIGQLWRVLRRVPEHQYDLYILSDHGQAPCTPYQGLRGDRFERWIFDRFLARSDGRTPVKERRTGLARGILARRRGTRELLQHFLNYTEEDYLRGGEAEAYERDGIRVIAAGPNAFLYVLAATAPLEAGALDERFPDLAEKLSQSDGVGFVLARSSGGPICYCRGKRYLLGESESGPFSGRPDASLVVQAIKDLMEMQSAGDLVIYGIDAPQGHISFIPEELGAHGGPSPEELHTFIMRPGHVNLPLPISHPAQLYDHFIQYQK